MRLPRRIFLNVVIFVSSFLVVSYHLSSIVPQDGTVHNVLYRYLFRTIFLFRPRAPAAPCSRSFLLSYCSTPPLKRKIKFSLQTVPFVPTPAAFFSAVGGVVIRRTIRKNPFFCGASCRGLLVCAQFALQGPGLLSTAQYKDFSARVVIQRTFLRGRIFPSALLECCAHFSLFLFRARGLLYSTLFKNPTKFSLPPFSCKKTFLPLLRSAHCCVLHIRVGMLRTALL